MQRYTAYHPSMQQAGPAAASNSKQSTESAEQAELDLSFGIEIECLLLISTYPKTNFLAEEEGLVDLSTGQNLVREVLQKPLKATCAACGQEHKFSLPMNTDKQLHTDPLYTKWTVEDDISLELSSSAIQKHSEALEYVQMGKVEIKSRVLSQNNDLMTTEAEDHTHQVSWQDEIQAVCAALEEAFNTARTGSAVARIAINESCGLHVHIGNGQKGFPLRTVKNILSLFVANEKPIDSMHATSRINGSTLVFAPRTHGLQHTFNNKKLSDSVYNLPWSAHLIRGTYVRVEKPWDPEYMEDPRLKYPGNKLWKSPKLEEASERYDVPSWLTLIQYADNMKDLVELNHHPHGSNINLQNLKDFDPQGNEDYTMTIEFRQHAGSRDAREIISWIEFLVSIVQYAHNHSSSAVRKTCLEHWSNPELTVRDLLREISAPSKTKKHYQSVLGKRKEREPFSEEVRAEEREALLKYNGTPLESLNPLISDIVSDNATDRAPAEVQRRIERKFLKGCYGQYEKEYLKELKDLGGKARKRLRIGFRMPKLEEDEEMEDSFAQQSGFYPDEYDDEEYDEEEDGDYEEDEDEEMDEGY